jgi:AraC-like DNA-binding protein
MNNKTHTIAAYYANAVIAGAERLNYDTEALLKSAGLSDIKMDQRVAPQVITQLIQSVWKQLDDEFMGFTQQRCKQGVFAIMAQQSIQCQTLRQALVEGTRFYHLIRNDLEITFHETDSEATLSLSLKDEFLDPDNLLIEFFLLIWHRFSIWLVGNKVPLKYADFKYSPPDHVKEYSLFFPCHCRFNQAKNSIVFDRSALSLPIKRSEKELNAFLKKSPADLLSKPLFSNTFTSQVMTYMGEAINEGSLNAVPLIEDVASYFNMSSRNLRRRLSEENNSYQSIKDTLRKNHAIKLLTDNELAINQISREVGFNEPAAFTRAFKQWTGQTPRNFRQGY